MSTHAYTESQLVEQPAIGLFAALGWQTVSARSETLGSSGTLGRETKGEVVLVDRWEQPEQNDFLLVSEKRCHPPNIEPAKTKRSPAPAVHAATRAVRRELRNAYFGFVTADRNAAEKLRAEQRDAPFPTGCFPPPLPFVSG